MKISQQLTLSDYQLYLKESIFSNSLYKFLRLIGIAMFMLILYKFFNENMTYSNSMNGLIIMAFIVFNFRWLSYFNERRRLIRSSYFEDLLEAHDISIENDTLIVSKNEQNYVFTAEETYRIVDYPHFFVIEINELSHFPILKKMQQKKDLLQIQDWFNKKIETRKNNATRLI